MAAAGEGRVLCAQPPEHRSTPCARPWWHLPCCPSPPERTPWPAAGSPPPASSLALLALTGLASTTATRLKLNFPAMAGLLGAGQLVLHNAFTVFSGPAPGAASEPAASPAPHHLGPASLPVGGAGEFAVSGLDSQLSSLSLLMLAGHALATLLCALLLARGEAALWALAAWLRPLLRLPVPAAPVAVAAPAAVIGWPADSVPLPVAEPPARLPPRAARRRRIFLTLLPAAAASIA